ncbi:Aste57867_21804 [Aphanomyces stellatus]|uniref:Aste57867_21804 protein n=1 Tax=Aphanomyces stellatus TaxID=120398 RepID=A0A485LJU3_9STRA|nr:hypothetical protein As57867_021735 [Aphanomyces stellatus]VFT98473.1 Aste57867_21804 [Aphanomyces stellatus]
MPPTQKRKVLAAAADESGVDEELKEKRRLQWKLNQRNSRQKRQNMASTLSKQNEATEAEIARLQAHLQSITSHALVEREPTSMFRGNSAVRVIEEYYQVFQNGFAASPAQQAFQFEFVRKIMTSGTSFMNAQGAESVVNQWRLMTTNHHSLRIKPVSCEYMKEGDGVVVRAVSRYIVRISRKTLEMLYPHVLSRESLVQNLIGLEVDALDTVHSYFDVDGRIIRHDVVIDFVNPLIKLLGNIELAAEVLNGAHLADNGLVDIERNERRAAELCSIDQAAKLVVATKGLRASSSAPNDLTMLLSARTP